MEASSSWGPSWPCLEASSAPKMGDRCKSPALLSLPFFPELFESFSPGAPWPRATILHTLSLLLPRAQGSEVFKWAGQIEEPVPSPAPSASESKGDVRCCLSILYHAWHGHVCPGSRRRLPLSPGHLRGHALLRGHPMPAHRALMKEGGKEGQQEGEG